MLRRFHRLRRTVIASQFLALFMVCGTVPVLTTPTLKAQAPFPRDPRLPGRGIQDPRLRDPRFNRQRGAFPNPAAAGNARALENGNPNQAQRPNQAQQAPNRAIQSFVEQTLIPAYEKQNAALIIKECQAKLSRMNEANLAEIDVLLKSNNTPSLAVILTDARILLQQSRGGRVAKPSPMEAVLIVGELKRRLNEFFDEIEKNPLLPDKLPRPKQMVEYRDFLWNAHVDRNRLLMANQIISVGRSIQQQKNLRRVNNLSEQQKAILETDFRKFERDIRNLVLDLEEGSLELRVRRLAFASKAIDEAKSTKERFLAAYALGSDGQSVVQELKKGRGRFARDRLNTIKIEPLQEQIRSSQESAGDLTEKSQMLFAGLHWWRRGRYGAGPVFMGLFKGPKAAIDARQRIGLFMPVITPVPNDPMQAGAAPIPTYDRRHHYHWAYQDRDFTDYSFDENQNWNETVKSNFQGGHFDGMVDGTFW